MMLRSSVLFLSSVFLMSVPMFAHHSSFAAEYDDSKPIKVTGVLTKIEWVNPHIWFYVDERDATTGKTIYWAFTGGAPVQLMRRGITKDKIRLGITVTVDGFRARDGSENGFGGKITFSDGQSVFTGNDDKDTK
jgi:hypothetical protein